MLNYIGFAAHFVFLDLLSQKYSLVPINLVCINVKETVPTVKPLDSTLIIALKDHLITARIKYTRLFPQNCTAF